VESATGHLVYGVLFEPTDEGWAALDSKEGAPVCYRRNQRTVILPDGHWLTATVYEVTPAKRKTSFCSPSESYLASVATGLLSWQLPTDHLMRAAHHIASVADISRLFVYGTLMQGQSRFSCFDTRTLLAIHEAQTQGCLHRTNYDFPVMTLLENNSLDHWVYGQLLQFSDLTEQLPMLDFIESFQGYDSHGCLYQRTLVMVNIDNHEQVLAWTYVAANPELPKGKITSGRWTDGAL